MKTAQGMRALIILISLFLSTSVSSSEIPFFWSEFESHEDWIRWGRPPIMENGSLILQSNTHTVNGRSTGEQAPKNARFVTQIRFLDEPIEGAQPWVGVSVRSQYPFYIAGVRMNGEMFLSEVVDPFGGPMLDRVLPLQYDEMLNSDVILEVETVESRVSARAWLDTDERPSEAHVESTETDIGERFGYGLWFNPSRELNRIAVRYFAVLPLVRGDFDADDTLDVDDIDVLSQLVHAKEDNRSLDLNDDTVLDVADRDVMVHELFNTYYGDANLDGEFNSGDLNSLFQAGHYEDDIVANSTWATGDWNGDQEFNTSDLVLAFQDGGYERGAAGCSGSSRTFMLLFCGCRDVFSCTTLHETRWAQINCLTLLIMRNGHSTCLLISHEVLPQKRFRIK